MGITQDKGANLANAVSARDGLLAIILGEIGVVLHAESYLSLGCVVPRPWAVTENYGSCIRRREVYT